ncbi:unnamed protein product [Coregonus sp. 'balchen']|nr:unnamed protein product [Coregonus sp. 'balchen']
MGSLGRILSLYVLCLYGWQEEDDPQDFMLLYPQDFMQSLSDPSQSSQRTLSCYQTFLEQLVEIEGSWRAHGKGLSIWDKFAHTPFRVDSGDIACDSYNKIDEDVEVLKMLKASHYHFSICCTRVLPDGTNKFINEAGLNYYQRLLDALLAANIQPQLKITLLGFRKILKFIKDEYGNPSLYVTENEVLERGEVSLDDYYGTHYYENCINQALKGTFSFLSHNIALIRYMFCTLFTAPLLDGVDLRGYTAWSLMGNFEWAAGYSERFGLFIVNRSDPKLPRVAKSSPARYATIIKCNGFSDPALGPHECLNPEPEGRVKLTFVR